MKTHQDEKCCKASSPGRWSCRNKCDGPSECCSGGSGPRSRKSGWNSVPEKKAPISPTIEMTSDLDEDGVVFWSSYERSLLAEHQAVVLNRTPVVQNFNLFQRQQCHFSKIRDFTLTRIGFRRRRRFQISLVVRLARISPSVDRDLRLSFDTKYLCQKYLWKNKEIPLS